MITFRNLIQFSRYPCFLSDLLLYGAIKLRAFGIRVRIDGQARFRGWPIFSTYPKSLISIGKNAYLISRSRDTALGVGHCCIFRTLRNGARISIGNDFRASGVTVCAMASVLIGDRVVIGADVVIADTDFHAIAPGVRCFQDADSNEARVLPVQIGSDVFIGCRAVILKGALIGHGAVIGAGSVVTRNVAPFEIVAGNPARVVGTVKPVPLSTL